MKIRPLGTVFLHADGSKEGRTNTGIKRTKVKSLFFYSFANVRKYLEWCSYILHYDCVDKCNVLSDGKCRRHEDVFGSEGRNPRFLNFERSSDWHYRIMPLFVKWHIHRLLVSINTGLLKMIARFLTTCHNTLEIAVYVFFYLIEKHSSFCYVPYTCFTCAPFVILQRINTIIEFVPHKTTFRCRLPPS
jgi:hypothetical protein